MSSFMLYISIMLKHLGHIEWWLIYTLRLLFLATTKFSDFVCQWERISDNYSNFSNFKDFYWQNEHLSDEITYSGT